MGLPTVTTVFLRRRRARKDAKPAIKDVPSARKPRLKDLTAPQLVDSLAALRNVASPDHVTSAATLISADPALLADLVRVAAGDADPCADKPNPPRERLQRSWVAATLLRAGPASLRDALSARSDLVRKLVDVFAAPPHKLDEALANNVALLLRSLLHDNPKNTATALLNTGLVDKLVTHVALQPCADLLPRLVGTRVYDPLAAAAILPAHKRAVAMLGAAHVQKKLADTFVAVAATIDQTESEKREHAVATLAGCASAMNEMSARAMSLPRKHEDYDERADVIYAGNLSLVTSAIYNDARDHLDLLRKPAPLEKVFRAAVKAPQDVFIPAMQLFSSLLAAYRTARSSRLMSIRSLMFSLNITAIGDIINAQTEALVQILRADGLLGRRRLAVIDLLREACDIFEDSCLVDMFAGEHQLMEALLHVANKFGDKDLVIVRITEILSLLFSRCPVLTTRLLQHSGLLSFLKEKRDHPSLEPVLGLLFTYTTSEELSDVRDDLIELQSHWKERQDAQPRSALLGRKLAPAKMSSDTFGDFTVEGELAATEDYGEELYLRTLLGDVSKGEDGAPPSDSYVAIAAAEMESQGHFRGLSKRWRAMSH